MIRRTARHLARLTGDQRGLAAVEFALILPFMALLYFGAIEVTLLIGADRKVTQTASSLADLVARTDSITQAEIDDVFEAASVLFAPFDASGVELRISSVIDDSGVAEVEWSEGRNIAARAVGDVVVLDAGVLPEDGSVIMAEVTYQYDSALGFFLQSATELNEIFYLRPRQGDKVVWDAG
ncbi:MAG: TadE/TadG family type IV pilus assembly protein [Alphaproteobacteria bacterium]|nr:TadE/TadG family type IV pilus assembly protein [Alphaproteobacteria bacterium]